jgi:hypothetical protein
MGLTLKLASNLDVVAMGAAFCLIGAIIFGLF